MLGVVVVALFAALVVGIVGAAGFALTQPDVVEVTSDMVNVAFAVESYTDTHDAWPASIDDLGLSLSVATDPWGQPYQLTRTDAEPRFDIVSAGPDLIAGTPDDIAMTTLDRTWEHALEQYEDQLESLDHEIDGGGCGHHGRGMEREYLRRALESMDAIPLHD